MGIVNGKVVKVITPPRCVREGIWFTEVFVNVNDIEFMIPISGCTKLEVMTKIKVGADVMVVEESSPIPRDAKLFTTVSIISTKGDTNQHKPIKHDNSFLRKDN